MRLAYLLLTCSNIFVVAYVPKHLQHVGLITPVQRKEDRCLTFTHSTFVKHRRTQLLSSSNININTESAQAATPPPQIKRLPHSAIEVSIPVPGSATQAAYDKICTELSKTIQIPGFRKGQKIPPQVLEQSMVAKGGRNAIKVQAIQELINQLVQRTLQEQALEPIGQPKLVVSAEELATQYTPGQGLTLTVQCDVWPDIQWQSPQAYMNLTAAYKRKPFNQERLEAALRDLRERYAVLAPIVDETYVLQKEDACVVNMEGYLAQPDGSKGEALPSNVASGERVDVVLGSGRYTPGLVEGLVGAQVGETRTVQVQFPEKLRDKTLAGKPAIFDVKILEASSRTIPEVNDEFANKVRAGLTADALLAELRKAIDQEDAKEFTPARNKALSAALSEVLDVEVPDTLVTNQAREKFAVMMADMRDNGVSDEEIKRQINPENFKKYKDIVKADIVRDFKVSMATDEIARLENIEVPAFEVEEQFEAVKKEAAQSSEKMDEAMIRTRVETTIQRQKVMDWLAERAILHVEYEEETFDEELLQKLADESLAREKELANLNDGGEKKSL